MQIRIGLETAMEGRALGFALDYPGVFAYGADEGEVLLRMPHALLDFDYWVRNHTIEPWFSLGDLDFRLSEVFETHFNGDYEINAFFEDDRRILSARDCSEAALIHRWQREELLAGVETLPPELLSRLSPNQGRDINGILAHIASVEYWYLDQLKLALPPFTDAASLDEKLSGSFDLVQEALPKLACVDLLQEHHGELWSPRKVVRRLLWHQRDHIEQIKQLAGLR